VFNITDCAGNLKKAEKRRYFSRVRGFVMEFGALFDLFNAPPHLSSDEYRSGKLLLTRIGATLLNFAFRAWHVTTLFRVRAPACSRPETPILSTRFHDEP
jgi:hypothetical protein